MDKVWEYMTVECHPFSANLEILLRGLEGWDCVSQRQMNGYVALVFRR